MFHGRERVFWSSPETRPKSSSLSPTLIDNRRFVLVPIDFQAFEVSLAEFSIVIFRMIFVEKFAIGHFSMAVDFYRFFVHFVRKRLTRDA